MAQKKLNIGTSSSVEKEEKKKDLPSIREAVAKGVLPGTTSPITGMSLSQSGEWLIVECLQFKHFIATGSKEYGEVIDFCMQLSGKNAYQWLGVIAKGTKGWKLDWAVETDVRRSYFYDEPTGIFLVGEEGAPLGVAKKLMIEDFGCTPLESGN